MKPACILTNIHIRGKKCLISIFLLFVLGAFSMPCLAQNEFLYHIKHKSTTDGLPHLDVMQIGEDKYGYMWFATLSGLGRYDGYHIKNFIFTHGNDKYNRINSLKIDTTENIIYLGTEGGLVYFDINASRFKFPQIKHPDSSLINNKSLSIIYRDSGKRLWINADGKNIIAVTENGKINNIMAIDNLPGVLPPFDIIDVTEDEYQNYWVGLNKGMVHLTFGTNQQVNMVNYFSIHKANNPKLMLYDDFISTVNFDHRGNLILGTYQAYHLIRFSERAKGYAKVKHIDFVVLREKEIINLTNNIDPYEFSILRDVEVDNFGNYWFSAESGLIKVDVDTINIENSKNYIYQKSQQKPYSTSANTITDLCINSTGILFAGTFGGGVNFLDTKQKHILYLKRDMDLPNTTLTEDFVRAVCEDTSGNLWIGTQTYGLNAYNMRTHTSRSFLFKNKDAELFNTRNKIRALYLENNRWLWIGALDEVFCFDIQKQKEVNLPQNFKDSTKIDFGYISDIGADTFGNLWITRWKNGIQQIKRGKNEPFNIIAIRNIRESGIDMGTASGKSAHSLCFMQNQRELAVGTQYGILLIQLNNKGEVYNTIKYYKTGNAANELSSNMVWDIVEVSDTVWYVGTLGGGINRVRIQRKKDALGNGIYWAEQVGEGSYADLSHVECMVKDYDGNIWIAGKSIYKFNVHENVIEPFDFSKATFNNTYKVGGSYLGKSGNIYFGGTRGLNFFNPKNIQENTQKPNTQITQLLIHNVPVNPDNAPDAILRNPLPETAQIELNYKQNNFTLWFSGMQFENPEIAQYKYKLIGYDKDWKLTNGHQPNVTYSNLKYRKYVFKVMSSNNDGVWDLTPAILHIRVKPPLQKTKLAYLVYALILTCIIILIYRYQDRFFKIKNDLELKRLEEAKKEELYQEKIRFFTNISHEIRTPLTMISLPLQDLVAGKYTPKVKSQLNYIYNKVEKLHYLIDKLVEFRKVESGVAKLKVEHTNLYEFIHHIAGQFYDWADKKSIDFSIKIPDNNIEGWIDKEKCESVVYNLLTNALKYTPEKGKVSLQVFSKKQGIDTNEGNTYSYGNLNTNTPLISIVVADTGIGVDNKELKNIFERYYQAGKSKSEGYGIGLALVKGLINIHKGFLQFTSYPNKGTTVQVCLPTNANMYADTERIEVNTPQTKRKQIDPELLYSDTIPEEIMVSNTSQELFQNKLIKGKILLIEDNEQIRSYLRANLSKLYEFYEAGDGNEGYSLVEKKTPDVIICDVMLPGMNGFEICRRVKENPATSHIPVIILTAKSDMLSKQDGADAGADVYIAKPFSLNYLITEVNNVLKNRQMLVERLSENALKESYKKAKSTKETQFGIKLKELIKNNMDKPDFGVDFLCKELSIARSNFYIKVKEVLGVTPNDFIKDYRLECALNYLINNNLSVAEAAYKVGMSPTHLSKAFKAKYKKSPTDYIKGLK